MKIIDYFKEGFNVMGKVVFLCIINIVFSLLSPDAIDKVLKFRGFHIGVKFNLPTVIVELWDFVSLPQGIGAVTKIGFPVISHIPVIFLVVLIPLLILTLLIVALVSFIYLRILMTRGLGLNITTRASRILDIFLYNLLLLVITFTLMPMVFINVMLLMLYMIIMILISYFIYATPFIIVGFDKGVKTALKYSITLAHRKEYLKFTLFYIVITLLISPFFTLIAVNGKLLGIIIGSVLAGIVGLWLTSSTTLMVLDLAKTILE
mgnify:CR=1 FL=1